MPPKERKIAASRRKKQTRLTFDPVDASSPARSGPSPAKVRFEYPIGSGSRSSRQIQSDATIPEDDSDSDDILFSSSMPTKGKPVESSSYRNPFTSSATKQSESRSRATRGRKKAIIVDVDSSDANSDDSGGEEESMITQSDRKAQRRHPGARSQNSAPVELSSDSEDEDSVPRTRRISKNGKGQPSPGGHAGSGPPDTEDEESDSDAVISTQTPRRRQQLTTMSDNDSSEDPISSPLKRTRAVLESDESDIASSPLKRRRPGPSGTPRSSQSNSRNGTPNRTTRQSKTRRHRTDKEKAVELMKRRRAGEDIEEVTESSESDSENEGSDFQKLSEFEDDDEDVEVAMPATYRKSPKKAKKDSPSNGLDEYDSDFVESDGDLGVPTALLDIPLEFTNAAHKPLKAHFKDAVEWMVHRKVNPGFNRDDQVYRQAFLKLSDEYVGYAKSKFVSSQWTAEFTRAIYARPTMTFRDLAPGEEIEIAGQIICQVCNHRKYVPKYEIQFLGKPYDKDTLDELERESDSENDSDESSNASDVSEYDANGQKLPPESKTWLSGQYCKANAEQAHSLIHWKWALNDWVVDTLKNEGYLTPKKLAEREKMKAKKRRKYANDIVDAWESQNQIKDLYRDFKTNLETAREASNQGPWQNKRRR